MMRPILSARDPRWPGRAEPAQHPAEVPASRLASLGKRFCTVVDGLCIWRAAVVLQKASMIYFPCPVFGMPSAELFGMESVAAEIGRVAHVGLALVGQSQPESPI